MKSGVLSRETKGLFKKEKDNFLSFFDVLGLANKMGNGVVSTRICKYFVNSF